MTIRYYFDFVSPYAWVGFRPARALAARHGLAFEPAPVLFAALLDAHGHQGPAEIPAKRVSMWKDAYRKAHARGLPPLKPPPTHPFNPLAALRAATAAASADLVDALFAAAWVEGRAIDTAAAVSAIAAACGVALPAGAAAETAKQALRSATEEAVRRGVFGVPTLEVTLPSGSGPTELFWGSDTIEHADAFLRGEDPAPQDPAYFDRPASAGRRRRET